MCKRESEKIKEKFELILRSWIVLIFDDIIRREIKTHLDKSIYLEYIRSES